jgi:hypothetical protein
MRQAQQNNRRGRGRGRKAQNPLTKNYESNGPDVKIRGTAAHISEKYNALARDALSSSDIVRGENYLQHAEHYNRIIMAAQQQNSAEEGAGKDAKDSGEETSGNSQNQREASSGNGAANGQSNSKRQDNRKSNRRRRSESSKNADGNKNKSEDSQKSSEKVHAIEPASHIAEAGQKVEANADDAAA